MSEDDNNYEMENLRFESENSAHADIRFANFTEVKMWLYLTKCTLENGWFEPKGAVEEAVKVARRRRRGRRGDRSATEQEPRPSYPASRQLGHEPCVDCAEPFSLLRLSCAALPYLRVRQRVYRREDDDEIRLCRFCEQIRKRERQAQLDKDFAEGQNSGISKCMKQCENERDPGGRGDLVARGSASGKTGKSRQTKRRSEPPPPGREAPQKELGGVQNAGEGRAAMEELHPSEYGKHTENTQWLLPAS